MLLSKNLLSYYRSSYDLLSRQGLQHDLLAGPVYGGGGIDAFTKLMLHMDGTNASTTFTDYSPSPKTVTANGNAQISTAQSKFGGASGLFDGTGDYLSIASNADLAFGTGDWTIDFWVRFSSMSVASQIIYETRQDGTNQPVPVIYLSGSDNKLYYFTMGGGQIGTNSALSTNTWYHIAVVKSSGTTKMYVNGIAQTATYADSLNYTQYGLKIGAQYDSTNGFSGNLDELRVSKGIARWTANFTPPTSEYVA